MNIFRPVVAVLCVCLFFVPLAPAQQSFGGIAIQPPRGLFRSYRASSISPVDLSNSGRLESLLRAGKIYLSLQDAIALALENNLDIAAQRYGPLIAEQDLKRAKSGGLNRGISQTIQQGPASAPAPTISATSTSTPPATGTAATPAATTSTTTGTAGTTGAASSTSTASATTTAASTSSTGGALSTGVSSSSPSGSNSSFSSNPSSTSASSSSIASSVNASSSTAASSSGLSQLGPSIPTLDPVLTASYTAEHFTSILTNLRQAGTFALVSSTKVPKISISKNWLTGTSATLSLSNQFVLQNTGLNSLNPSRSATLDLVVLQPLLQGFSIAVNNRDIRIAKNEVKLSSVVFKSQVIATVSSVVDLYWDLVAYNENVDFAKQNLALAEKSYNDTKAQVQVGTLASIETVRAEAEIASRQQDLTVAETSVLEQETILKNGLSKNGVADPLIAEARIVPTDRIRISDTDGTEPLSNLIDEALRNRPELEQSRLGVENNQIQLKGTKNELLPTLNLFVELTNHGLAGAINAVPLPPGFEPLPPTDSYFIGGYGTALGQIFRRNFPDYTIGFQLNIPFRNRAAQSDYVHDQLTLRESEFSYRQQENQIRVDVQNAVVALRQARAQYDAAIKQRVLEEQTLDAEQKMNALGAATVFEVIQAQRDLAQAQSNQVSAESQYQKARVNLEQVTGRTLSAYNININEAISGHVSRPPSPIQANP